MPDGTLLFDTKIDTNEFERGTKMLTAAGAAAAATLATVSTAAIKVGKDYEASMSQVAATMGITANTAAFDMMSDAAKNMGETTQFSASQAAEALNYLALAGYDAEKSVKALPTVLNVAAAGGMELASASDMITDAMSALGLEMSELDTFADQLAATAQKSNTSVAQLGDAILTVGGTAKSLSGGVTEMNTALGILADNGIKGAEGGTALRNVILSLSAPTSTAAAALKNLSVSAFDASGNMRPLEDTFADLDTALSKLTQQERTEALNNIFNKVDLKAVNALLGTSSERFGELSGYISDCEGAAAQMAETMNNNLKGDLTIFGSALEGLGIAAYDKFQVPMRTAVQDVTEQVSALTASMKDGELSDSMDKVANAFGNLTSSAASLLANDVIPAIINGFAWITDRTDTLIPLLASAAAGLVAFKVASVGVTAASAATAAGITSIGTAASAAAAAMTGLNPVMLAVVAASALLVGTTTAYVSSVNAELQTIERGASLYKEQTDAVNDLADAYADAKSAARDIIGQRDEEISKLNALKEKLAGCADENGKVKKGYEELAGQLLSEINEIYPEEIKIIDGRIRGYSDLCSSIDDYIGKLREEALYESKKAVWKEALATYYTAKSKDNALLDTAMEADSRYKELRKKYDELYREGYTGTGYMESVRAEMLEAQGAWEQAWENYEKNHTLMLEAESDMKSYGDLIKNNANLNISEPPEIARRYLEAAKEANKTTQNETLDEIKEFSEAFANAWKQLDHDYAMGTVNDDKELYRKRLELLSEYGDERNEEYWSYYEKVSAQEKSFSEEEIRKAKKDAEEKAKIKKEADDKAAADLKNALSKQDKIVDDGLDSILQKYKEAYDELDKKRESYRQKLLSVGGDIFSVDVSEDEAGNKITKYTVNNVDEQLRKMREYHSQIKALREQGMSEGLLAELTSMKSDDNAEFAKYLSGMSSSEFAKVNELYNEKQKLAKELSQELYADEAKQMSDSMTLALSDLASTAYDAGLSSGEQFTLGFVESMNKAKVGVLMSQMQAAGGTKSYENYITVNPGGKQEMVIVTDISGKSNVYLDGTIVGEMVAKYQSEQEYRGG